MKDKMKAMKEKTQRVLNNGEQAVQAVSLLTVAVFSYYALTKLQLNWLAKDVVLVALIIIGLRGAYEFVQFLDKPVKKK